MAALDLNGVQKDTWCLQSSLGSGPHQYSLLLHSSTVVNVAFITYPHPTLNATLIPYLTQTLKKFSALLFPSYVFPRGAVEAQQPCLPVRGPLPLVLTLRYAITECYGRGVPKLCEWR